MTWEARYREAMGQLCLPEDRRAAISAIPRREAAGRRRGRSRLRLAAVVLAAVLLLSIGGVALAGQPGIQAWFTRSWESISGAPMEGEQSQLLQALTQPIGVSDTVDGVTVTADSAVVGDDSCWLLLTVSGLELSPRYGYTFGSDSLTVTPDPHETGGGIFGWGLESHGVNADGEAELLLQYSYQQETGPNTPWTEDLTVTLRLRDLIRGRSTGADGTVAEGEWVLTFPLKTREIETITIPDVWVEVKDRNDGSELRVLLREITLTATGIRFSSRGGEFHGAMEPTLLLADGTEVGYGDGSGTPREDGLGMYHSFHWRVPVALDQVSAVRFGDTVAAVPGQDGEGAG